jgi:DNA-3-methyladenine glycosylase II
MNRIVNEKDIAALAGSDKMIFSIHRRHGAPPNWSRPAGFVSLSKIILEQQVSLASANAHFLKLNNYIDEFTPANILKLTDAEMRTSQISRQKSKYLRELSTAILNRDIDLEKLSGMDEPAIRRQLTGIKGIGNWTADIYLLFCLQAKDIFPIGDIAIVNTIKELTPARTREEMLLMSEGWKPFRSLASYFLWHYYLEERKHKRSLGRGGSKKAINAPVL